MGLFDSIAEAAAKKAAEIQKAASEVADAAAKKAAEIQKTAEEAAASASTIAGQAVDAISYGAGQLADAVSTTASEAHASIVKKRNEALNDIQEFAAIKFYDLINQYDYADSIKKMKEAQEKEKKDLSPLIGFLENLQTFALEGKKQYIDKKN